MPKSDSPSEARFRVVEIQGLGEAAEQFVTFPDLLYPKGRLVTQPDEERALIAGTHPFSPDFTFRPFLVWDGSKPCGRFALTWRPDDETAYLGFFECTDNPQAAVSLFAAAVKTARDAGAKSLRGPINASFWLSYRMKTDYFEAEPYFTEPYNLEYYPDLWQSNGFEVCESYSSNIYHRVEMSRAERQALAQQLAGLKAAGYEIVSPNKQSFSQILDEVYQLFMTLYRGLPGFSVVTREAFVAQFGVLRQIIDYRSTKVVYYEGKMVAFLIAFPDYGTRLARPHGLHLVTALLRRLWAPRYIAAYLGVTPAHHGLGRILGATGFYYAWKMRAGGVGSLIHEGVSTEKYAPELREEIHHYALYERIL